MEVALKRNGTVGWLLAGCLVGMSLPSAHGQKDRRQQGIALEQQGDFAGAESVWQGVLGEHPHNVEALAHLGLDEARQQKYSEAITNYRKALALDPQIPGLRLDLALSLFKAGRFPEAIPVLGAELRKHPGDQRLTILLGMAHYGAADYAGAVPYLRQAAAHDPQNVALRLPLAHACLWARQFPCVLQVYRQMLALNADSAEVDMLAGEAWSEKGDNQAAIAQFRAAEREDPKEPEVHFGLGYLLWTQRQYGDAEKEFRAELANNPMDGQSLAYLGDSLIHLGRNAEAQPVLERAVAQKATLELAHVDLGIVDAGLGKKAEALKEFEEAIALDPKDADPHWRLARLYQQMGRKDEARVEFAKVSHMKQQSEESLYRKMAGAPGASSPGAGGASSSAPR
jgi:tetratricopeptide (TPR) repeat protein